VIKIKINKNKNNKARVIKIKINRNKNKKARMRYARAL